MALGYYMSRLWRFESSTRRNPDRWSGLLQPAPLALNAFRAVGTRGFAGDSNPDRWSGLLHVAPLALIT